MLPGAGVGSVLGSTVGNRVGRGARAGTALHAPLANSESVVAMINSTLRFGSGCALGMAYASSYCGVLRLLGHARPGRVACGAAGQVWSMWSLLDMGGNNYIGERLLGQSWVEAAGLGSAWHPPFALLSGALALRDERRTGEDTMNEGMLH